MTNLQWNKDNGKCLNKINIAVLRKTVSASQEVCVLFVYYSTKSTVLEQCIVYIYPYAIEST